jgi:ribosomal protein S18 acetylase RimI-like enzyme
MSTMPAETPRVRPATHADFDEVAALFDDFMTLHRRWQPDLFRPTLLGFTPAIFQSWLDQPNTRYIVADLGGLVAGYVSANSSPGWANDFVFARPGVYITVIIVAAGIRRKGVGRALFEAIEAWAQENNAEFVGLNVNPSNDAARAFYASLGYDLNSEYRAKTMRTVRRFEAEP